MKALFLTHLKEQVITRTVKDYPQEVREQMKMQQHDGCCEIHLTRNQESCHPYFHKVVEQVDPLLQGFL